MNRLATLFENKKEDILSIYMTVGYPELNDTTTILKALDNVKVDFVEVGMPFSDPLADGPTIQASSERAIKNGITVKILFEQIAAVRSEIKLPLVFMGYFNQVLQFGVEEFCKACNNSGIDGVILPDLPIDVYEKEYKTLFEKYDIKTTFLITPETSDERINKIASLSSGFLYVVSSHSTTGSKQNIQSSQIEYFNKIKELDIAVPKIIGFGISNNQTFTTACNYVNGAIVGSAFIKAIENSTDLQQDIFHFIKQIRG